MVGAQDGRVAQGRLRQAESTAAWVGSPIKPLQPHGVLDVARLRGRGCAHTRPGKVGNAGSPGLSGHPRPVAMRHGMLPGSGTISPKPRSAGEARASFICGLPASGQSPRRPRFTIHQPEAHRPAGASTRFPPVFAARRFLPHRVRERRAPQLRGIPDLLTKSSQMLRNITGTATYRSAFVPILFLGWPC